ncbi:MAG: hypothetical protein GY810_11265 [Aureispira sp.]|nr:hypothetical protein [Aureispira sp.]
MTRIVAFITFYILLMAACQRVPTTIERTTPCEECFVVPVSGELEDLNFGFYYDQETKKCARIEYSSGGTGAPFLTMEDCIACCASKKKE